MKAILAWFTGLTFSSLAAAGLPAELDGSWYNPAQSGHGLSFEHVDAERAVMLWHVFDPQGRPLTLYVDGQIDGHRVDGAAYAPQGMRFGAFDPAELALPPWGEVDLRFTDCNHAELHYRAQDPAFGSGTIPLVRLLPTSDPNCSLAAPADLRAFAPARVSGYLDGEFRADGGPAAPGFPNHYGGYVEGLVDGDGVLHAALVSTLASQGLGPSEHFVLVGQPLAAAAGQARFAARIHANGWLHPVLGSALEALAPAARRVDFPLQLRTQANGAHGSYLSTGAGAPNGHLEVGRGGGGMPLRAGRYPFAYEVVNAAGGYETVAFELRVDAEDAVCVRRVAPASDCLYQGRVFNRRDNGEFDFQLTLNQPGAKPFTGSGRSQHRVPAHLILVNDVVTWIGDNGETGLYLYAGEYQPL